MFIMEHELNINVYSFMFFIKRFVKFLLNVFIKNKSSPKVFIPFNS